jgi:polyisoprenoid-binding protein YceI
MKSKYLDVEQFPEILFDIMSIQLERPLFERQRTRATVVGSYTLHGQTRTVRPEAYLTYTRMDSIPALRIEAEFEETLTAYNIRVPKVLFFKGADYQRVRVDITAYAAPDSVR